MMGGPEPTIRVTDESMNKTLQNFRNRIEELTTQNARLRFTLEAIKSSAQRELRRKPE